MFKNKQIQILLFAAFSVMMMQSCDKCCKDAQKALPDLVEQGVEIVNKAINGEFEVGDLGEIATFCINVADAFEECGTNAANENEHQLGLYHRPDSTGSFTLVGNANYLVNKLKSGESFEDNQSVTFNIAGDYYIGDIVDVKGVVTERDETNNDEDSEEVGARSEDAGRKATFRVRPNPAYTQRLQAGEQIPYFVFHDKGTLREYSMKVANGDWIYVKVR